MVPYVIRNGNGDRPFNIGHCDAELLAHLPHHVKREAFQEGIPYVPLLEVQVVLDR